MMGSVAAVAQSDQVRRLVRSSGRTREKVMHVRFSKAARSSALHAFVVVAPKYSLANVGQSADTANDERNVLIGAPKSALEGNAKSQR